MIWKNGRLVRQSLGVALLLVSSAASAQDNVTSEPGNDDTFTIGAGAAYGPTYQGSDDYHIIPIAALRGRVSGVNFFTQGTSLYVDLVPDRSASGVDIEAGAILGVRLERTGSVEDPQVDALGELDEAYEIGGFVGISKTGVITSAYDTLGVRVGYVHDVSNAHDSYVIQPSINYGTPLSRATYVAISASADYVGPGFAHYYSDVSPTGSAASGLPVYTVDGGGWRDFSLTFLGNHALSGDLRRGLSLVLLARYSRLLGDFGRSPIVAMAGDADQWMGGVGLAYTF